MMQRWSLIGLALAVFGLAACEDEAAKPIEYVRAIKTYTVTEIASGQSRKFSGTVQATDSAALGFQVSGNVRAVNVNAGDRVKKGQKLAALDPKPYELDVQAARADLEKARADLQEKAADLDRQKKLFTKGWIAKARLDQSVRANTTARSQVNIAVSKLGLAKRDLANTVLVAPFNGYVSARHVDPHADLRAGEKLFDVDAEGALEVAFDVPETTIARISIGMPVTIRLASGNGCGCAGRVTEIGKVAGKGNVFPVTASILDTPDTARSGMTAEVTLVLASEARAAGYLIPLAAIAPGDGKSKGYVFVFNEAIQSVRRTPINPIDVEENMIAVVGLPPGAVIAVAGVNFLVDGQRVKLLQP